MRALPRISFQMMNTVNKSTGYSPFQLRFGKTLCTPLTFPDFPGALDPPIHLDTPLPLTWSPFVLSTLPCLRSKHTLLSTCRLRSGRPKSLQDYTRFDMPTHFFSHDMTPRVSGYDFRLTDEDKLRAAQRRQGGKDIEPWTITTTTMPSTRHTRRRKKWKT